MDTTVKYIKMCEEAKKIQKEWKPKAFDLYFDKFNHLIKHYNPVTKDKKIKQWQIKENMIWLIYQDQLQEMVAETSGFDGKRMIGLELCNFWAWYQQNRPGDIGVEIELWPSWEQLWLKFVMKQKYNRLWDDKKEKWIK